MSMEHSTLNLLNSVYTKWVPRPLTAIIIVSLSEGRHIDLRSSTSKVDTSIFDHRPSTKAIDHRPSTIGHRSSDLRPSIIDLRPSTIDLRIDLRSSTIDLRPLIFEHRSSKIEGGNNRTDNSSPNIVHNGAPYARSPKRD